MRNQPAQYEHESFEDIVAYCGAMPKGDELPQVGSSDEMALDVFMQCTYMPREVALSYLHHQMGDTDLN